MNLNWVKVIFKKILKTLEVKEAIMMAHSMPRDLSELKNKDQVEV